MLLSICPFHLFTSIKIVIAVDIPRAIVVVPITIENAFHRFVALSDFANEDSKFRHTSSLS